MDRFFGKQLSNILQSNKEILNRISSKSTRIDVSLNRKVNRSSIHNKSVCVSKRSQSEDEKILIQKKSYQNPQIVPEYFEDCLKFMLEQEQLKYGLTNYMMSGQLEIKENMRGILLDWIIDLHHRWKMFPETLYLMTMILDKYISTKKNVTKNNLQLIGATAFFIAAKYEETYQVPAIEDLVHHAANAFTKQQLIQTQAEIIQTLNFDLVMETSYRFFSALAKLCGMEQKNFHLAQYILELSLLDTKFLEYKPSLLASSVIYLIFRIRKKSVVWPEKLAALVAYEEKHLKPCARQLCNLLQKVETLSHTKSLKVKFSTKKYNEVTRIKLQRKSE